MTIRDILTNIRERLQKAGIEDFEYESWVLLEWKLHIDRAEFYMNPNGEVKQELLEDLEEVLLKREQRVPLQYLMGECEFMGFDFSVDERVLIPRQDTETLVETVLKIKLPENPKILDLCSGSGCIAVSLALNIKNADVTAVEISDKAAEYIKKNAELNNTDLNIVKDDVLSEKTAAIFSGIDAIVCNPPYLTAEDMKSLQKEVTFEPETALFGGKDGLDFYRSITKIWKDCLKSGGILAYEIGMGQEDAVMKILEENNFINIEMTEDLSGIIRVVRGEKI